MWKFLVPALIASTVAFAQAPNQPNQAGQAPTQAQPNQGAAAQSGVTTLNPQGAQGQPNASGTVNPGQANARAIAIQQIEQSLQMLKQNQ
jgi:hypothetical protein